MKLVVVESPAKAKTIKKYLGKDFEVLASYGHVRDLVPKEGAVDPDHGFRMKYQVIDKNERHVQAIAQSLKKAEALILATDPDREGEAISWHLYELLQARKLLRDKPVHRVVFNEVTKRAVNEAIEHPRTLSSDLIDAQQARRALDYLVGFNLSPLLWKKVRRGLSAGRVQSPALRLIVEREEEIERFQAREFWTIEADATEQRQSFVARLVEYQGEKLGQFSITDGEHAEIARANLLQEAMRQAVPPGVEAAAPLHGQLVVETVTRKQRRRNPAAPFTTSTLQQEASRKLGFSAQRTMRTAQQLYEGVDIGGGAVGLISYMRTDSVSLAAEAVVEIREYIEGRYGKEQMPSAPRQFKTKAKNAQEAHEAIRPTAIERTPALLQEHLSRDQFRLYELVWKRTVACQMVHATIDTVAVELACGEGSRFRANGSTVRNSGFMAVYLEGEDDQRSDREDERTLPPLVQGQRVHLQAIRAEQHFTEPPPRFSEASLVKALEEFGIGRPSTYASIISTLLDREYALLEKKRFFATDVGRVVNRFLTQYFTQYVDYDFTARLEDELDAVARGEKDWVPLLTTFWGPFKHRLDDTDVNVKRSDVTHEALDESCPECGKPLSIRLGRNGRFVGCTGYPECRYTRNLDAAAAADGDVEPQVVEGRVCPRCGSPLIVRDGRYGKFIGCSSYPTCKHLEPLEKPRDTEIVCAECGKGTLLQRKSRKGKVFYSCSTYPDCSYAVWNMPVPGPCPKCGWPILTVKTTRRRGTERVCPQRTCTFAEPWEEEANAVGAEPTLPAANAD